MSESREYRRSLTAPLPVLAIFILLLLVRLIDPLLLTRENEYIAVIVLQLMIFMIPAAVYLRLAGRGISSLRLNPIGIGHLLLIVSAIITLSCGILLMNYIFGGAGTLEQSYDLYGVFISKSGDGAGSVLYLILAYAALPAICEEFMFRAVLCAEYERRSTASAIIMPSLFFAMLHFDLSRFPAYFFAGIVLVLTFYATRSFFAPVIVHFCNNLLAVFGKTYIQTLYDLGGSELFRFIVTALFLLSAFIFCAEAARLYRGYSARNLSSAYRDLPVREKRPDTAPAAPLTEFAQRHPRITATAGSLFAFPALGCYLLWAIVAFFGL